MEPSMAPLPAPGSFDCSFRCLQPRLAHKALRDSWLHVIERYEELLFRDRLMSILDNHDASTPLFLLYAPKIAHYPVQAPPE